MRKVPLLALTGALISSGAVAQPSLLDVSAVPYLRQDGRATYSRFLLLNLPRAMAISSNGEYGAYGGGGTPAAEETKALAACAAKGGTDCRLYATGLEVVWNAAPAMRQVPGPFVQTSDHALVPDPRFIWHGPEQAKGVYIWGHGTGGAGQQPPSHVRAFNNAGWDVVRFDRLANDYDDYADAWLREGIANVRARGYRKVIVGGQSRGGWNALEVLDTPGLVDAVIATSPASFNWTDPTEQSAKFYRMMHRANAPGARVIIAQFTGDNFAGDEDKRAALIENALRPHVGALILIDRPAGFTGHFGAEKPQFAWKFGACMVRFVSEGEPCQQLVAAAR